MPGAPNKRLRREEYQRAQAAALLASSNGNPSNENGRSNERGQPSMGKGGGKGVKKGGKGGASLKIELPKKKFYRQRAHANPFSDHALIYPSTPSEMDWSTHFPHFISSSTSPLSNHPDPSPPHMTKSVEIADIGCGFGGLIVALSPIFPDTLMIGMELRTQVLSYVVSRVAALRHQSSTTSPSTSLSPPPPPPPPYSNISALRTNTMKTLPQYFPRASLTKIFICFPDPHFKTRKHKARIVSRALAAEYAYVLKPGVGKVYTITDVQELGGWMAGCFDGPNDTSTTNSAVNDDDQMEEEGENAAAGVEELFERVPEAEYDADPCIRIMTEETEEAKKVTRNGGTKYIGVWRRTEDPEWL